MCESHRPDLALKFISDFGREFCENYYRTVTRALIENGVDGFVVETMNCWQEAEIAMAAVKEVFEEKGMNSQSENSQPDSE